MGNKVVIYRQKLEDNLKESYKHLMRLKGAIEELERLYSFPVDQKVFDEMIASRQLLAYSDQIIYRFSKLQDVMGAKLFKSVLLYLGENTNKPFLDILNQLEKIDIIDVDEWFEIRDLRNEIAHDYDNNDLTAMNILNTIYQLKDELNGILNAIGRLK
jgi:uncharacterized protein with HEPN domain